MTFIRNQQRGSIIIYAILTMSAMLAVGLTLTGLFVGKLRIAANARNSTIAIYVADSAVEMCLYEARANTPVSLMRFDDESTYTIVGPGGIDVTDDCSALGSGSFNFRATGLHQGVRRTLEITQ